MITTDTRALEASGLRKSYGDTVALDGIDLTVGEGTIFGRDSQPMRLGFVRVPENQSRGSSQHSADGWIPSTSCNGRIREVVRYQP